MTSASPCPINGYGTAAVHYSYSTRLPNFGKKTTTRDLVAYLILQSRMLEKISGVIGLFKAGFFFIDMKKKV